MLVELLMCPEWLSILSQAFTALKSEKTRCGKGEDELDEDLQEMAKCDEHKK